MTKKLSWRELVAQGKKHCPSCDTIKTVGEFNRNAFRPDNCQSRCKKCQGISRQTPERKAAAKERYRKRREAAKLAQENAPVNE
jgi:hypothetical protein